MDETLVGDSLIEKISKAVDETDYLGVILSKNSVKSKWVRKEVNIAIIQEIKGKRVKVLPFLLDNCDIPSFLSDKVYADFRVSSNYEKNSRELSYVLANISSDLLRNILQNQIDCSTVHVTCFSLEIFCNLLQRSNERQIKYQTTSQLRRLTRLTAGQNTLRRAEDIPRWLILYSEFLG